MKIPKEYTNRSDDYVSFSYRRNGDAKFDLENVACYSTCMTFLPECEFTLYSKDKSKLPFGIFSEWIRLCQANGLVVPDARVEEGPRGNVLVIPQNNHNHHQIYSSLCCFRWSENQPGCPYVAAETKNPELDFFQVLHYALLEGNVYYSHHSFTVILTPHGNGMYAQCNRKELIAAKLFIPYSIGLAGFFRGFPEPIFKTSTPLGGTQNTITYLVQNWGLSTDNKKLYVASTTNLLSPKLAPLYRKLPTVEEITRAIS